MTERRESGLVSRNVRVNGVRTSLRLEVTMWDSLTEIAHRERVSMSEVVTGIARQRDPLLTFTAAVRVFLVDYFRAAATEQGHQRAGHGVYINKARPPAHTTKRPHLERGLKQMPSLSRETI